MKVRLPLVRECWAGLGLLAGSVLHAQAPLPTGEAVLVASHPIRSSDFASLLTKTIAPGVVTLADAGSAAPLLVAESDWPGVLRASHDLQSDIERVTGLKPAYRTDPSSGSATAVFIGTIGKSTLIDRLITSGKLNVDPIRGKWEAFIVTTVEHPLPGIDRAVVIAGSDKRGTIYGIYELSQQIGVSPWYWWADVPAAHHDTLYIRPGTVIEPGPAVKYRGIFLNDEAPDLTNWVRAKFG